MAHLKLFRSLSDGSDIRSTVLQIIDNTLQYLIFVIYKMDLRYFHPIFFLVFYGHNSLIRMEVSRVLGCFSRTDSWLHVARLLIALTTRCCDLDNLFVSLWIACVSH